MHVHLPKPLHGWRALLGEVGIIVIGVLIALAGEQLVETLHWRSEAREFRKAVDHEAGLNIGSFEFSQLQQKCIRRRLDELETLVARSRNGQPVQLAGPIGMPLEISELSSVWDNKDPQVVEHLPLDIRLEYAELYDEFRNTEGIKAAQSAVWKQFSRFEEPGPLTLADRRDLHALIADARGLDFAMESNWPVSRKLGAGLGIKAALPPEGVSLRRMIPQFEICKPVVNV